MSEQRETLKFGDPVVNIAASDDNPIKHGIFVRNVVRTGRLNVGCFVEYMTEDGDTHHTPPDNIAKDGISAADEIASLRASLEQAVEHGSKGWAEAASLRAQLASARKAAIEECMEKIGNLRQSEAGLFDAAHSGQRGEDRSTALYDAYDLLRKLATDEKIGT